MFSKMKVCGAMAAIAALAVVALVSPPIKQAEAAAAPALSIFSAVSTALASVADGAGATIAVPAPGSILGDACVASLSVDAVDVLVTCYIQAAGAAEVRVQNESGTSLAIASTTVRVFVLPRGTR